MAPLQAHGSVDNQIVALSKGQIGVVGWEQLRSLGLSYKMITSRQKKGFLDEVFPRAFLVGGTPIRWDNRLLAAQFSLGPTSAVSHRSSAVLQGIEGYEQGALELTLVGQGRHSLEGIRIHRTTVLKDSDLRAKGPFRVSCPERLMLELAGVVSPRLLEAALDSVLFKGLTTFPRISAYLEANRRRGLPGVSALEQLLAERDPDQAPAESVFETDFYRLLKTSPWADAIFQHKVFDQFGFIGRLDVAYPEKKVGIEAYSKRWHSPGQRVDTDAARHNRFSVAGWRILYETWANLKDEPERVLDRLEAVLALAA
jgi:hypothetical protein